MGGAIAVQLRKLLLGAALVVSNISVASDDALFLSLPNPSAH
jgi:hypothetical protein